MKRIDEKMLDFLLSRSDQNEELPVEFRQDPDFNHQLYSELKQILDWDPEVFNYKQADLAEAWEKISIFNSKPSNEMKSKSIWKWVGIAASFLIIAGAAAYFFWFRSPFIHYESESDSMAVLLPDSTKVDMQPHSKLTSLRPRQFLREESREVTLEGEAVFTVQPGESPVRVVTEHTSVDVLPAVMCMSTHEEIMLTVFRLRAVDAYSEAENIEGVIRFAVIDSPDIAVTLNSGDKAAYQAGDENINFIPAYVPSPPPPPTNQISVLDFFDILGSRYPERLIPGPYLDISNAVIEVNMNLELEDLLSELDSNPNIEITYSSRGNGIFDISAFSATDIGLEADYTWNDFENGRPFKQPEDVE